MLTGRVVFGIGNESLNGTLFTCYLDFCPSFTIVIWVLIYLLYLSGTSFYVHVLVSRHKMAQYGVRSCSYSESYRKSLWFVISVLY